MNLRVSRLEYWLVLLLGLATVAVGWPSGPSGAMSPLTVERAKVALPPPTTARLNINRADLAELEQLPGIGPALAARIVAFRNERPFYSVDELLHVSGIGAAKMAGLRDWVTVGDFHATTDR